MRPLILATALLLAAPTALAAQRLGPAEERPRLRDVVDTNDAQSYYDLGLSIFERDAKTAAAAFYWAARINPSWGEPLYARRAALLMNDRGMLRRMFDGGRRDYYADPDFRRLDSLQFRALMLSPFLYRRLDYALFASYVRQSAVEHSRAVGDGDPSTVLLNASIEQYLRSSGPWARAWVAYARGDFERALRNYERAYEIARDRPSVRFERARIYGMLGKVDSAAMEMRLAVDELRKQDQDKLVVFYESKALAEFSVAVLLEGTGATDRAREAYGNALQEDLAYYPAHMRLGLLALGKRDTTTALSELALAAQLAAEEPFIRYTNGWALGVAKRYPEAIAELRKAIELEPYYALPYLRLGQIHELTGNFAEAAPSYERFLARASKLDVQRPYATERLTEVKETLATLPKP